MYEFKECEVYFTSTVSGFAANGQQGTVVLSATYDAADPAPVSLRQVEDADPHTVPCLPSTSVVSLRLDCATMHLRSDAKFVRGGPVPNGSDIKTYDAATVFFTTVGCANTSKIGELHVRYKCRLYKPVLDFPEDGVMGHWHGIAVAPPQTFTGLIALSGNDVQFLNWTVSGNTLTFPAGTTGRYLMMWQSHSQSSQTAVTLSSTIGCTGVQYWCSPTLNNAASFVAGSGAVQAMFGFVFEVTSGSAGSATFAGGVGADSCGRDLFVSRIPATLVGFSSTKADADAAQLDALKADHTALLDRMARLESLLSPIHVEEEEQKSSDPVPALQLQLGRKGMFTFK
jgi:hypothetical protein